MGNQQIHQGRGRRLLDRLKFLLGAGQSWTVRLTVFPILISIACPVSASESEQIRILSTNDIHTYMRPIYYRYLDQPRPWGIQSMEGDYVAKAQYEGRVGGMAYVASVINQLRSEKLGKTLLVDSGDTWHGSGLSVFDKGVSMVKAMNAIGYDAMVPGNWEYFYPRDHLLDLIDQADFPVIAYNLTDKDWGDPVLEPYIVKQVGNLKIAVIGMTYPWTALTSSIVGAAQWWNFGIKEEEAQELIDQLREGESADLIVFISHAGYGFDQQFAQRVDGIDVIVSGHTHNPVFDPVVRNNTIIYESGAQGEYVGCLDLEVKDKQVISYQYKLVKVQEGYVPADPVVEKLVEAAYRPHADILSEVIGYSEDLLYRRDYWQSPIGNLVTDAMRYSQNTDIALFPAWRYGATLMPGEITVENVYNIVPTDGHIFTYQMAGKDIKTLLENIVVGVSDEDPYSRVGGDMIRFSGLNIVYDLANQPGEKIVSITMANGTPFVDDKEYAVASAHTRFQLNPLFGATDIQDTGKVFAEELIKYIRENSPIESKLDDRIRARKDTSVADR